jgi:hypothetical protein
LAHHWLSPEKVWLGEWDGLTISYPRRQNVYTKREGFPGKSSEGTKGELGGVSRLAPTAACCHRFAISERRNFKTYTSGYDGQWDLFIFLQTVSRPGIANTWNAVPGERAVVCCGEIPPATFSFEGF